jgi:hypothetical protein
MINRRFVKALVDKYANRIKDISASAIITLTFVSA